MTSIALLYGSSTGRTKAAAEAISCRLLCGQVPCLDVRTWGTSAFVPADVLVVGASTWSVGELQADWERLYPRLDELDLSRTRIALFGLGDQKNYRESFADAVGLLHDKFEALGARLDIGHTATDGYTFVTSEAVRQGRFCGLVLDDENQADLTLGRIDDWCAQLRAELGLPETSAPAAGMPDVDRAA